MIDVGDLFTLSGTIVPEAGFAAVDAVNVLFAPQGTSSAAVTKTAVPDAQGAWSVTASLTTGGTWNVRVEGLLNGVVVAAEQTSIYVQLRSVT